MDDIPQLSAPVSGDHKKPNCKYTFTWPVVIMPTLTCLQSSGTNSALSSRLVPQSLLKPATAPALINAIVEAMTLAAGNAALYLTTPFSYPDPRLQTSVTPAWRSAVWHVVSLIDWPWDGRVEGAKAAYAKAADVINPLRDLTPGGGAYQVRHIVGLCN